MKSCFFVAVLVLLFASCTTQKTLYSWGNYEIASYNYLKNTDEESIQSLIENYLEIIQNQTGTRGVVPPGICADYGFILLQEGKTDEGKEMLMKEIALYPESEIFIGRIIKMIED
jgi:hypothetical protein